MGEKIAIIEWEGGASDILKLIFLQDLKLTVAKIKVGILYSFGVIFKKEIIKKLKSTYDPLKII